MYLFPSVITRICLRANILRVIAAVSKLTRSCTYVCIRVLWNDCTNIDGNDRRRIRVTRDIAKIEELIFQPSQSRNMPIYIRSVKIVFAIADSQRDQFEASIFSDEDSLWRLQSVKKKQLAPVASNSRQCRTRNFLHSLVTRDLWHSSTLTLASRIMGASRARFVV